MPKTKKMPTPFPNDVSIGYDDRLDRYLDGIKHLPPAPTLMIKLIEIFRQADYDVDEVARLLRSDPALAAEVLRRCNNFFLGEGKPELDIHAAVFRLGSREVYRLGVSLFGMQAFITNKDVPGFALESLRRHSGLTAIAAAAIAGQLHEPEDAAFTAGLLHDVGKVALASAERAKYIALLHEYDYAGAALNDAETRIFGFNHADVGAQLLRRWRIPEEIARPAFFHHSPPKTGDFKRLVAIVYLANLMAHHIEKNAQGEISELPDAGRAMSLLGIDAGRLSSLMQRVCRDLKLLPSLLAT